MFAHMGLTTHHLGERGGTPRLPLMDVSPWECVAQVCGSDLCGVTPGPLGPEQFRLSSLNPPFSPGRILGMWVNLLHPYSPQDHFTVKKGKVPPPSQQKGAH